MLATKVNTGRIAGWAYALLIAGMLITVMAAQARTYRWTDESGGVVYSQTPPPPGVAAEIIGAPPPPAESPEAARQRLEERMQKFEAERKQQRESQQEQAEQQVKSQQAAQNCTAAQHNLSIYADAPPNRLYKDDAGVYRRLDPAERDAKVKAAREDIAKYCK